MPLLAGSVAGYLITLSGYAAFCSGVILGFLIGVISAAASKGTRRRVFFGAMGNLMAIVVALAVMAFRDWRQGGPLYQQRHLGTSALLILIMVLPGIVGSIVIDGTDKLTRSRSRYEQ